MKCDRCGKENVDPVYPHTCTPPKALKLADALERLANLEANELAECMDEAAELRRLWKRLK